MNKESNRLFPVFLKLEEQRVLLIGGGKIGAEKLRAILSNSSATKVTAVSEKFTDEFTEAIQLSPQSVTITEKAYHEDDLNNQDIVFVAVNNIELAAKITEDAHQRNLLVNVADKPELCDFYLGSIVKKGNLKIAISTNGKSPTLAKRLKEILNDAVPDEINETAEHLAKVRKNIDGPLEKKIKELNRITAAMTDQSKPKSWYKIGRTRIIAYCLALPMLLALGYLVAVYFPPTTLKDVFASIVANVDRTFFLFVLAGFVAQMIDGALGMAYGVTATTFLLSFGVSPAASSASVHASEIFTSGVSGLMHLRFGNVNTKLFKHLLIPGVIGAIVGAYILSSFEQYNSIIKPIVSTYTLILGVIILFKAIRKHKAKKKVKHLFPLAFAGAFLDSIGGGGWGPIVSSTLIAGGRNPRYTIGSVNLAEFFISVASSVTFISLLGLNYIGVIIGLIVGGTIAAPIAAFLSNKIPVKTIMIMVGVLIIIVSLKRIFF